MTILPSSPRHEGEPLVDAKVLASHLGFKATLIRKLAQTGQIPCFRVQNGSRPYYRFRISDVEKTLQESFDGFPKETCVLPARDGCPR